MLITALVIGLLTLSGPAALPGPVPVTAYQTPPREVLDVMRAPVTPTPFLSPARNALLLARAVRYPPITDLAEPMLRLAGVRINPRTNGEHGDRYYVELALKLLPDGAEQPVALPAGARIGAPVWNARGTWVAFTNTPAADVELWVMDIATRRARKLPGIRLNPVLGSAIQWLPDQETLLVKVIPAGRGPAPVQPEAPPGPRIEETAGGGVASSTYEARDLLRGPAAERPTRCGPAASLVVPSVASPTSRAASPGIDSPDSRRRPGPQAGAIVL